MPVFALFSSKLEMNKWIEDLNMAIDMSKKSQEKSDLFLDPSLCDRSNSKYISLLEPLSCVMCW